MYIFIYIYKCTCIYIYIYIYEHMYIYQWIYMCTYSQSTAKQPTGTYNSQRDNPIKDLVNCKLALAKWSSNSTLHRKLSQRDPN